MSDALLLADDSLTMRRVVELTLAREGLRVVSVSDGQQAIDHIVTRRPALALISVGLQKVSGFEVARFVRDHPQHRVPVVLLAGAFDNLDDAQVRASGAAGVLVKPFEPSVVIKRVKELLGMKGESSPAATADPPDDALRRLANVVGGERAADSSMAAEDDAVKTGPGGAHPTRTSTGEGGQPIDDHDQLNAVFESLDAQLAAHSGVRGRATTGAQTSQIVAPDHESGPSSATEGRALNRMPGSTGAANPVFEVDNKWFDEPAPPTEPTPLVITRASDFGDVTRSEPTPDDRSCIPAYAREVTEPSSGGALPAYAPDTSASDATESSSDVPSSPSNPEVADQAHQGRQGTDAAEFRSASRETERTEGVTSSDPEDGGEDALTDMTTAEVSSERDDTLLAEVASLVDSALPGDAQRSFSVMDGPYAPDTATGASAPRAPEYALRANPFVAADAFALIWAQEQGEPLPPQPPPPPFELAEQTIDALAMRLLDGVADRVMSPLASRVAEDLGASLSGPVADRVVTRIADPLKDALADRIVNDLAVRLEDVLAKRLELALTDKLMTALTTRFSSDLAERVAELVAERALHDAFGNSIRRSVNEIAERVVRAEIERIRAAAGTQRAG